MVNRRIAQRAGLYATGEGLRIGELCGYVDLVSSHCIQGWAQNAEHPEVPVCLDVYADGRLIGRVLANNYREDLAKAGLGSGQHSFTLISPAGLALTLMSVEVRRSLDGAPLPCSGHARAAA